MATKAETGCALIRFPSASPVRPVQGILAVARFGVLIN
jgi:hypothetical protein